MQTITDKILSRIYGHGRGWVFSQMDFFDLGDKDAIAQALSRATRKGTIRRLIQGVYDYPRFSDLLQEQLPPDMPQAAEALARKYSWSIIPEGSTALQMLGLDTQVPARYFFLSSGPNREYDIQGRLLKFIHRKTAFTALKDHYTAALVQAIQALGQENITEKHRKQLSTLKSTREYRKIVLDTRPVTAWIHDEIMKIAALSRQEEFDQ